MPRNVQKAMGRFKQSELISEAIISSEDKIMEVEEIDEYILQKVPKLALEKICANWKECLFTVYTHLTKPQQ